MHTQKKMIVSLYSTNVDGETFWNTAFSAKDEPNSFKYEFYSSKYFGRAQYYADYLQYLFGITTGEQPECFDYDDKCLNPPDNFDFSIYEKTAEEQPFITLLFCPMPETNGKQNWTLTVQSPVYESFELSSYQSEFYDDVRWYYDNLNYLFGYTLEAPNPDNYNYLLQKDAVTGEEFIKE